MRNVGLKAITVTLLLASLWGCVQTRPVPGYARPGDVVVLGLGGIERNSASEPKLASPDLTISITDSDNVTYPLTVSNVFKSYPEYKAFVNTSAITGADYGLGLEPFDGGRFAVVLLSTPGGAPLPLATGPATISISSPKLINTAGAFEGNLATSVIDILPGTASVDSTYLAQFIAYSEDPNNFIIAPEDLSGITDIAGAFFKIDYSDDTYFKSGVEPIVVPSGHNPYVQMAYNVVPNGNGTGSIIVTLLNPAGFKSAATGTSNSSLLADLSINLVYFATNGEAATAKTKFDLDTSGSYYIDSNGAKIAGLTPTFTHQSEL